MFQSLSRSLTALALSVTLAMGGMVATAGQARADRNGEAAAVLGGLLLLYGIANSGNRNHQPAPVQRFNPPHGYIYNPPIHQPHPQYNLRTAPRHCFVQGHDNNGRYRGYEQACMQVNVAVPHLLPQNCLRRVYSHQGWLNIYGGRCLSQNGWVTQASH